MYVVLEASLTIGTMRFTRVPSVSVEHSVNQVGATADLILPTRAVAKGRVLELAKELKAGMPVEIELGYSGVWRGVVFKGYLRRVEEGDTLKLQCEDAIYLLRAKSYTKSWKATTLKEVVAFLIAGTGIELSGEVPDVRLSPFYLKNVNGAKALQRLRDEYGLGVYFTPGGSLYVGLNYGDTSGTVRYNLRQNVVNTSLKYRNADDVQLRIKAVHIDDNNQKTEVEVGDKDASLRTYYFYDISDRAALRARADELLLREKYSGYEGSITTFLVPHVLPGMRADITDTRFGRSGSYFVEKVKITYGTSGARREVWLGVKLG